MRAADTQGGNRSPRSSLRSESQVLRAGSLGRRRESAQSARNLYVTANIRGTWDTGEFVRFRDAALPAALCALFLPLSGCAGSTEPAAHTPESLLEALRSEPEFGLECDDYVVESNGLFCAPTGQGTFDRLSLLNIWISSLDFDKTLDNYRMTHETRCSTKTETYESVIDGSTNEYIPYEKTSEEYLVIGKNLATMPILKVLDAQAVADITGGLLVSGKEWCDNPRPLVDFGK